MKYLILAASATLLFAVHFDSAKKLCRMDKGHLVPNPSHEFNYKEKRAQAAAKNAQRQFCNTVLDYERSYIMF